MWSSRSARALAAGLVAAAGLGLAAAPAGAAVVSVYDRGGKLLAAEGTSAPAVTLPVQGAGSCPVPAGTPLAALAATRVPLVVRAGACAPAGLYVSSVGGRAAAGADGWVYKVGHRAGTAGAADASGPFGDGRLVALSAPLTWFWCEQTATGGCQRTLDVARSGRTLRVTGYDDEGRGKRIARAAVTVSATTTGRRLRRGRTSSTGTFSLRGLDLAGGIVARVSRSGLVPVRKAL